LIILADEDLHGYHDDLERQPLDCVSISSMHHIHAKATSSYDLVEPASFEASLARPFTQSDPMMCQRPWVRPARRRRRARRHWTEVIRSDEPFAINKLGLRGENFEKIRSIRHTEGVRRVVQLLKSNGSVVGRYETEPQFIATHKFKDDPYINT